MIRETDVNGKEPRTLPKECTEKNCYTESAREREKNSSQMDEQIILYIGIKIHYKTKQVHSCTLQNKS